MYETAKISTEYKACSTLPQHSNPHVNLFKRALHGSMVPRTLGPTMILLCSTAGFVCMVC